MKIVRITMARLYNLGNYEHIRYELTAEIAPGKSATTAFRGMSNLLRGLKPPGREAPTARSIALEKKTIARLQSIKTEDEWNRVTSCGGWLDRKKRLAERAKTLKADERQFQAAQKRRTRIQKLFDDLGGASKFTDAKCNWAEGGEF